jgi:uncharacterized protein
MWPPGAAKMHFDWDESNLKHIAEHGISSDEAEQVIQNEPLELEEETRNSEQRIKLLGKTDAGRILLVIATYDDEKVRVVTAWPAKQRLRAFWLTQTKGNAHGTKTEDP